MNYKKTIAKMKQVGRVFIGKLYDTYFALDSQAFVPIQFAGSGRVTINCAFKW
jgi:hypothetical protein